jgi:hypothetical protein
MGSADMTKGILRVLLRLPPQSPGEFSLLCQLTQSRVYTHMCVQDSGLGTFTSINEDALLKK